MTQADLARIRAALGRLETKLTITPFEFDQFLNHAKSHLSTATPSDIARHKYNIRMATELIWNFKSVIAVLEVAKKKPGTGSKRQKEKVQQQVQAFFRTARMGLNSLEEQVAAVESLVKEWMKKISTEEQRGELDKLEKEARAKEMEARVKWAREQEKVKESEEGEGDTENEEEGGYSSGGKFAALGG